MNHHALFWPQSPSRHMTLFQLLQDVYTTSATSSICLIDAETTSCVSLFYPLMMYLTTMVTLEHQVQQSCLTDYGINCINGFPWDFINLVSLGVAKLLFWKKCPRGARRLFTAQLSQIENKLAEMMRLEGQIVVSERYFQFHWNCKQPGLSVEQYVNL